MAKASREVDSKYDVAGALTGGAASQAVPSQTPVDDNSAITSKLASFTQLPKRSDSQASLHSLQAWRESSASVVPPADVAQEDVGEPEDGSGKDMFSRRKRKHQSQLLMPSGLPTVTVRDFAVPVQSDSIPLQQLKEGSTARQAGGWLDASRDKRRTESDGRRTSVHSSTLDVDASTRYSIDSSTGSPSLLSPSSSAPTTHGTIDELDRSSVSRGLSHKLESSSGANTKIFDAEEDAAEAETTLSDLVNGDLEMQALYPDRAEHQQLASRGFERIVPRESFWIWIIIVINVALTVWSIALCFPEPASKLHP